MTATQVPALGTPIVTRFGVEAMDAPEVVPFIAYALANRVEVGFSLLREDLAPLFTLRAFGPAIHVLDAAGRHLGTFADVGVAVEAGWTSGWWHG